MEKKLTELNRYIRTMREESINGARAIGKSQNRPLFSRQSLINHKVRGYGNVIEEQDR